jgi:putative heme transporter
MLGAVILIGGETTRVHGSVPTRGHGGRRRWVRPVVGMTAAAAVVAVLMVTVRPTLTAAVRTLTDLHPGWLAAAVAVESVSVLATAQLHRVMIGAAGVRPPRVGDYLAVTYVGGAVSSSLPGGPALATAYTYRQLRARGVSQAHAGWALTISGVLSTAVMALASTLVFTLDGNASLPRLAVGAAEVAAAVALAVLARWATRHPQPLTRVLTGALGRLNALWRRPAGAGGERLDAFVAGVSRIRPRGRHWVAALVWAAADWGADAACLALCLLAVGTPVPTLAGIVGAYVAGVAATQLAFTPAGLGVTEAAITAALMAHGSPAHAALAAVLLFRLLSPGLNTAIGAVVGVVRPLCDRRRTEPTQLPGTGGPRELATLAA